MKFVSAILACAMLTACAGHPLDCSMGIPHGDCAPGSPGFYNGPGRAEADANQCTSYGFAPGTDGYANCRMGLDQGRQQRRDAVIGAIIQNNQHTSDMQQQNLNAEQRALSAAAQSAQPRSTNCTTTYSGDQAYTHCQ